MSAVKYKLEDRFKNKDLKVFVMGDSAMASGIV